MIRWCPATLSKELSAAAALPRRLTRASSHKDVEARVGNNQSGCRILVADDADSADVRVAHRFHVAIIIRRPAQAAEW
jgi:hypothetical protein